MQNTNHFQHFINSLFSGEHALMRKSMPHFGPNMLFMDKVSNLKTKKVGDQHSELMPEVMILVKDKDFLNYLLVKKFQSKFQLSFINKK